MSKPSVVSIPHRLGKDDAARRLKNGLGSGSANFGHVFKVEEQIWTGPQLQYRISAFRQVASGSIDVAEEYVRLEVFLPWLLAKLAEKLRPLQGRYFVTGKENRELNCSKRSGRPWLSMGAYRRKGSSVRRRRRTSSVDPLPF
jgi:hypothetical protein